MSSRAGAWHLDGTDTLFLFASRTERSTLDAILDRVPPSLRDGQIVALFDRPHGDHASHLIQRDVHHVVNLDHKNAERDFAWILSRLGVPESASEPTNDSSRLARLLDSSTAMSDLQLSTGKDRIDFLRDLERLTTRSALPERFSELLQRSAEELISNALFGAADQDCMVESIIMTDGRRWILSVSDDSGTLQWPAVRRHLGSALIDQDLASNPSGGGLGLSMVLRGSTHVLFDVLENERTTVTSVLDVTDTFRGFAERGKSVSFSSHRKSH